MSALPKHRQVPAEHLDSKVQTITPSLLESLKMEVGHLGQQVYFKVGNHEFKMDYPSALKLSILLRAHGKQAKKFAGDFSRNLEGCAVLTDAEQNYKRGWD